VKLPGPSPTMPNIYDFSITYDEMYKDLLRKDSELYPFFILMPATYRKTG
jgi:RNA polymerase II subunit A C-terminal domain phosphatase SSU72